MKITHFIPAVAATALIGAAPLPAVAQETHKHAAKAEKGDGEMFMDDAFMNKAADGGMTEVELGKIAAQNGERQDVKDFGNKMTVDHSKANEDLKSVAAKKNVTLPEKPSAEHQAMIDKFSKMTGAAFDAAYIKEMVKDHVHDVGEFEKASKEAKDSELKGFVDKTLPTLKEHLQMIQGMAGSSASKSKKS